MFLISTTFFKESTVLEKACYDSSRVIFIKNFLNALSTGLHSFKRWVSKRYHKTGSYLKIRLLYIRMTSTSDHTRLPIPITNSGQFGLGAGGRGHEEESLAHQFLPPLRVNAFEQIFHFIVITPRGGHVFR